MLMPMSTALAWLGVVAMAMGIQIAINTEQADQRPTYPWIGVDFIEIRHEIEDLIARVTAKSLKRGVNLLADRLMEASRKISFHQHIAIDDELFDLSIAQQILLVNGCAMGAIDIF